MNARPNCRPPAPLSSLCLTVTLLVISNVQQCGAASNADTLFTRIGGQPVINAVVADTIDQVAADPRINQSFNGTNLARIKRLLAEQLCDLTGGPCHYVNDSVREVHAGHHITEAEFYGLVEVLRRSLIAHHVRLRERNELLALLAPMERDIVEPAASNNGS